MVNGFDPLFKPYAPYPFKKGRGKAPDLIFKLSHKEYTMLLQPYIRRRPGIQNLIFPALLFILFHRACSSPLIGDVPKNTIPLITVDMFYENAYPYIDKPVIIEGEVIASFYLAPLGGFFFLKSLDSDKTMVCLLKDVPPQEFSTVSVLGVVKPILIKENIILSYIKYQSSQALNTLVLS